MFLTRSEEITHTHTQTHKNTHTHTHTHTNTHQHTEKHTPTHTGAHTPSESYNGLWDSTLTSAHTHLVPQHTQVRNDG